MQNQATTDATTRQAPVALHIVQSLRGGGAETFVRELIPRLAMRGIDARALCAYGSSQLTSAETEAWVATVYCQERSGVSRIRYLMQMRRLLRQIAPDIVHTHTHVGATWGRAAAILERAPIIIHTEHGHTQFALPAWQRAALKILNPRTDVIVTFSERTAEVVRRREKIRDLYIIPNGIRVRPIPTEADRRAARQKLGLNENHVVLGVIANLHPYKNPALAINAIARLPARTRDDLRLAFFGDGELHDDLLSSVNDLGVQAIVRFYGFRADLEDLLPGLDLIVSTSALEMMPMSLLESMNAALPIIGTPHPGTLDLVVDGETGIVLRSWDAQELAEAIEWAAVRPEWRSRAGNAGHERLRKNFDIEAVADRYVELYHRLLSRNGGTHQRTSLGMPHHEANRGLSRDISPNVGRSVGRTT